MSNLQLYYNSGVTELLSDQSANQSVYLYIHNRNPR